MGAGALAGAVTASRARTRPTGFSGATAATRRRPATGRTPIPPSPPLSADAGAGLVTPVATALQEVRAKDSRGRRS